eukprot:Seg5874.2 transcript_id=Seg5874.2/GoldUCD/mRNA.D3Y31 product="hypothetical protein" protein_id=Seg5874.2/GoldUCD/D3Y31
MEVLDKVSGERVDIAAAIGFEIVERTQAENVQQREKVKRPKRKLTKYKLVNSLDAALDEENYKELNLSESDTIHVGYLGSRKKKETELIKWSEKKPVFKGRQNSYNVITEKPGVKGVAAKSADTPRKAFELFFFRRNDENCCRNDQQEDQKLCQ